MKSKVKRLWSIVLCLAMVMSVMQFGAIEVSAAPTVFSQKDSRWGSHTYGNSNIYDAGCGILALVNAVYYMNGNFIEPIALADYSVNNGYRINGVGTGHGLYKSYSSYAGSTYGFSCNTDCSSDSVSALASHLKSGNAAIISTTTLATGNGHLMTIVDYDSSNNTFLILDSYISSNRFSAGYSWQTINPNTMNTGNGKVHIKKIIYIYNEGNPNPKPNHTIDSNYPTSITAVPKITSGSISVYDIYGNEESNRRIDANDDCTIKEVYTDNWMLVNYPSGSTRRDAYIKKDQFFGSNSIINSSWSPSYKTPSYKYSDLTGDYGSVFTTDNCKVVGQSSNNLQVIYPVTGGYKLGWINSSYNPNPAPIDYKDEAKHIGPVASGAFSGKTIIATALYEKPLGYIDGKDRKICKNDICYISDVNSETATCTVTYPTDGLSDVRTAGDSKKTITGISIDLFINYDGSYKSETMNSVGDYHAYPTYTKEIDRSWSLDTGDKYTTINKINGFTEVLYYVTRGTDTGYWKLGWVDIPYYSLDLNGYIDGVEHGNLRQYGYADVYINGVLRTQYANDFYTVNGTFPQGSTYEIKNIKAYDGHTYNGVHSGSISGTLTSDTCVSLDFTKNIPSLYDIELTSNPTKTEYLEGDSLNTAGLKISAIDTDGNKTDVTSSCNLTGYDSTPGVKTVVANYGGKKTAFTVIVKSKSPTSISVEANPTKTKYKKGEQLNIDGLQVKATYDNGTSEMIDSYDIYADEDLTATEGTKTIAVDYYYNDVNVNTSFDITVIDAKVPTITIDNATVKPGDTFEVPVKLSNNPGIASLKLKIEYDSSLLTLDKVEYNSAMGGSSQAPQKLASPLTLNWYDGSKNYNGDCTFATLTFTATSTLTESTTASFTITYDDNNIYNILEENLGLILNIGDITIKDEQTVSVTGVSLDKETASINVGETETLTATVTPQNATNKSVNWSSSNTSVATVLNGVVTAVAEGTATITVTTVDGSYIDTCEVTVNKIDANAPTVSISGGKAKPGETIEVTLSLSNNKGFSNLALEIGYDSSAMTLTNVTNLVAGASYTANPTITKNPYNIQWDSASNVNYNGNLATLTFTISETAQKGNYPITVGYYKGRNGNNTDGDDVNYDADYEALGLQYIGNNINIFKYIPGDINGDQKLNNKDATTLLRYFANWEDIVYDESALDVNGDAKINNKDATHLLRYFANWDVELH